MIDVSRIGDDIVTYSWLPFVILWGGQIAAGYVVQKFAERLRIASESTWRLLGEPDGKFIGTANINIFGVQWALGQYLQKRRYEELGDAELSRLARLERTVRMGSVVLALVSILLCVITLQLRG